MVHKKSMRNIKRNSNKRSQHKFKINANKVSHKNSRKQIGGATEDEIRTYFLKIIEDEGKTMPEIIKEAEAAALKKAEDALKAKKDKGAAADKLKEAEKLKENAKKVNVNVSSIDVSSSSSSVLNKKSNNERSTYMISSRASTNNENDEDTADALIVDTDEEKFARLKKEINAETQKMEDKAKVAKALKDKDNKEKADEKETTDLEIAQKKVLEAQKKVKEAKKKVEDADKKVTNKKAEKNTINKNLSSSKINKAKIKKELTEENLKLEEAELEEAEAEAEEKEKIALAEEERVKADAKAKADAKTKAESEAEKELKDAKAKAEAEAKVKLTPVVVPKKSTGAAAPSQLAIPTKTKEERVDFLKDFMKYVKDKNIDDDNANNLIDQINTKSDEDKHESITKFMNLLKYKTKDPKIKAQYKIKLVHIINLTDTSIVIEEYNKFKKNYNLDDNGEEKKTMTLNNLFK
jgi:hypothetical protein